MNFRDYPILYVDDDSPNRVVMKHNLGGEFKLLIADSAPAALEILAREPVAVLLTDQRMPGMTGVQLAEEVLNRYPEVIRVIITAYSDPDATIAAINRARVNRFIKKPWTREELVAVVRESLYSYHNAQLLKELRDRLMQLDRVASVAVMASSIAHDIRQPLTYIEPTLQIVRTDIATLLHSEHTKTREIALGLQDAVEDIKSGIDRISVLSQTLLKSIRADKSDAQSIDVARVVENAVLLCRGSVVKHARLELDFPSESLYASCSEGRLIQLVVNLLVNAAQSIRPGAPLRNEVKVRLRATPTQVVLLVQDTGCGIAPEHLSEVFKPFFTTKGDHGNGLGLAICQQVVEEFKGTIEVSSTVGKGTLFTVCFPRGEPDSLAPLPTSKV